MSTTKTDIILSLLSLAEEKGLCNVSLSDIALSVGIKKASIYSHFESQSAIVDASLNYCQEILESRVKNIDLRLDFKAKDKQRFLFSLLDNMLEIFTEKPLGSYLCIIEQQKMFSSKFRDLKHKIYAMIISRVRVALEFCVQKSWLEIKDTDAASDFFAAALMESILEIIKPSQNKTSWDLDNLINGLIDLYS